MDKRPPLTLAFVLWLATPPARAENVQDPAIRIGQTTSHFSPAARAAAQRIHRMGIRPNATEGGIFAVHGNSFESRERSDESTPRGRTTTIVIRNELQLLGRMLSVQGETKLTTRTFEGDLKPHSVTTVQTNRKWLMLGGTRLLSLGANMKPEKIQAASRVE